MSRDVILAANSEAHCTQDIDLACMTGTQISCLPTLSCWCKLQWYACLHWRTLFLSCDIMCISSIAHCVNTKQVCKTHDSCMSCQHGQVNKTWQYMKVRYRILLKNLIRNFTVTVNHTYVQYFSLMLILVYRSSYILTHFRPQFGTRFHFYQQVHTILCFFLA